MPPPPVPFNSVESEGVAYDELVRLLVPMFHGSQLAPFNSVDFDVEYELKRVADDAATSNTIDTIYEDAAPAPFNSVE